MAISIVLTNQKGGVGKTTTTASLIARLAKKGYKVLSIDLDPQGNLGFSLGEDIDRGKNIYDVLVNDVPIKEVIRKTQIYQDIIVSNILLSQTENISEKTDRRLLLKNALKPVENEYDFIIIDTPPALNILTVNAYATADFLVIPMASEILSLVGLIQLKETIEAVKNSINKNLNVMGILLTRYNKNTNLSKDVDEMAQEVAKQINTKVFDTKIRSSVVVAEAPAHAQTVLEYSPWSNPARDYKAFVDEVLNLVNIKSEVANNG